MLTLFELEQNQTNEMVGGGGVEICINKSIWCLHIMEFNALLGPSQCFGIGKFGLEVRFIALGRSAEGAR